jgi:hypothetical protein
MPEQRYLDGHHRVDVCSPGHAPGSPRTGLTLRLLARAGYSCNPAPYPQDKQILDRIKLAEVSTKREEPRALGSASLPGSE